MVGRVEKESALNKSSPSSLTSSSLSSNTFNKQFPSRLFDDKTFTNPILGSTGTASRLHDQDEFEKYNTSLDEQRRILEQLERRKKSDAFQSTPTVSSPPFASYSSDADDESSNKQSYRSGRQLARSSASTRSRSAASTVDQISRIPSRFGAQKREAKTSSRFGAIIDRHHQGNIKSKSIIKHGASDSHVDGAMKEIALEFNVDMEEQDRIMRDIVSKKKSPNKTPEKSGISRKGSLKVRFEEVPVVMDQEDHDIPLLEFVQDIKSKETPEPPPRKEKRGTSIVDRYLPKHKIDTGDNTKDLINFEDNSMPTPFASTFEDKSTFSWIDHTAPINRQPVEPYNLNGAAKRLENSGSSLLLNPPDQMIGRACVYSTKSSLNKSSSSPIVASAPGPSLLKSSSSSYFSESGFNKSPSSSCFLNPTFDSRTQSSGYSSLENSERDLSSSFDPFPVETRLREPRMSVMNRSESRDRIKAVKAKAPPPPAQRDLSPKPRKTGQPSMATSNTERHGVPSTSSRRRRAGQSVEGDKNREKLRQLLCDLRKDPMDDDLEANDGSFFPCEFCGDPYPVEYIMRHQVGKNITFLNIELYIKIALFDLTACL